MKKQWKLLVSLALLISLFGCSSKPKIDEEMMKEFDAFLEEDFIATMEDSYLNMHVFLEHPENYGIDRDRVEIVLSETYSDDWIKENQKEVRERKKKFEAFDRNKMDKEHQDVYDCFAYLLECSEEMSRDEYAYLDSQFNSMNGIHSQLPTLFADWVLRDEQDVMDLITLVDSTKEVVDGLISYTLRQMEEGTVLIDFDAVREKCNTIIAANKEGSTLVQMKNHIDEMDLEEHKKQEYKQKLEAAYVESFLPAYQDILNCMNELEDGKYNTKGLSTIKNGKKYYEVLFRYVTGSDKSINDIREQLKEDAEEALHTITLLAMKNPDVYEKWANGQYTTGYTSYEQIMSDLNQKSVEDFPEIGQLDYKIVPLAADLATEGIVAYFNLPALDSTTKREIRVNTSYGDVGALNTFTTLAHEGIPGHMYQTQYAYDNINQPWRLVCSDFSGYTEGYATYVELYSLKYLSLDEDVLSLEEAMTIYQNSLIALLDIGIHYDGWSIEDTKEFFADYGLNFEVANEIYRQIVYNPAAFLPYYVGYSEIAELKEEAMDELEGKFDDKAFHAALLKSGKAPYHVVEKNIEEYINSVK